MTEQELRDLWLKFSGGALCGVLAAPEGTLGEKPVAATLAAAVADQMVEEYVSRFGHLHARARKSEADAQSAVSGPQSRPAAPSGSSGGTSESRGQPSPGERSSLRLLPSDRTPRR